MAKEETTIIPLFASPLMKVQLDLDTDKLTEFAFEIQNKDKKGVEQTNRGGWHSNYIQEEKHEEFIKLKKEISKHLQTYHLKVFRGMVFKETIIQNLNNIWVNINEKHHYNDWHIHPMSTLSGVYYIKHDGFGHGDIMFKNPFGSYISSTHWPQGLVEKWNEVSSRIINITPKSNALFIFPSWLEHKVELNLKNDTRISISFNTDPILEKKS